METNKPFDVNVRHFLPGNRRFLQYDVCSVPDDNSENIAETRSNLLGRHCGLLVCKLTDRLYLLIQNGVLNTLTLLVEKEAVD